MVETQEFNIVETAQSTPILSSLVAAVVEAGLDGTLSGPGPFTVLAPTNDAFTAFLNANGWATVADIPDAALEQVLLNHVISGTVLSTDLASGDGFGYASTLATGAGDNAMSLYYDTSSGVRFNGVSSVVPGSADIGTSNGVVHVVDAVIGLPDVTTFATADARFSTLVTALTTLTPATDFVSVLQGDGPFTVFAPVNDAFDAITIPTDEAVLTQVLLNHVINGTAYSAGDLDGATGYENTMATASGGENLSIYYNGTDGVSFNGISNVAIPDVVASNGIIHAMDAVITLPTIVDFALADSNFSTLVTALTTLTPETDFVSVLTGAGPFTVFAPTDDAFALVDPIPAEGPLTSILLHHVSDAGNIVSGDLQVGDNPVPTLQGQNITVVVPGSGDNIANVTDGSGNTDAGIIAVDVQATNGVVHVLNKVLVPAL